ncbi:MAG TPA: NAD-dependent epimerase/dehydratase family protein, partial [Solirubrobacterales bacterium]|nr:NAD-dependent epimerase/dehydratase family protein [Solirubrobacterales bacterium]
MKRALITGGNGFVASHLARALLERGDSVTVLERAPRPHSALTLEGIRDEVEVVEADLRDAGRIAAAVGGAGFDVV